METNNRNYKNPTVIAWEQLRQLLTQFADRMQNFDAMAQKQGRDIGVDEVFNEIQNIRKQLDEIQKGLNLQNNTINTERVVDKSQPETPFSITNNNRNDESKNLNKKLIRLTESDLHKIVKESVNRVISEVLDTTDSIKYFYNSKGEKLNNPKSKIKGILDPKWKERKKRQMNTIRDKYDDIRLIDRHLGNMDDGYYHHDHEIDDSNIESWLDQESEKYPGFTNRQLRDLKNKGFNNILVADWL